MNVVLAIPDDIAASLSTGDADLPRQALEALALEGYRSGRLTTDDIASMLGLDVCDGVDGFLKGHGIFEDFTSADLEEERRTFAAFGRR